MSELAASQRLQAFDVRLQIMNTYIKLLLLLPLSATSCVNLSPEESVLIERAELIDVFPIKRNKLIKELELEGETGRRFGGGGCVVEV